jgi:hypothetical protein
MMGLLFIQYLYFLGLFFGLNFRHRIPLLFIIFSSFLWGSILAIAPLFVIYVFHIQLSDFQTLFVFILLILLPILGLIFLPKSEFNSKELIQILVFSITFFLLNLFFQTFNFSLATIDSFALLNLGRLIAYDGFVPNVLVSFTSWGLLVPLLQSMSVVLKIDYIVTLEVSYAISLIFIFAYLCYEFCVQISKNKPFAWMMTILSGLILISTPMFLIQSFYIHTNLPAACYFLQSIACSVFAIKKNSASWIILLFFGLIGFSLSRTETFIFSIPLLLLLLSNMQINYKSLVSGIIVYILFISSWLMYLFFSIENGTIILDKDRIIILVMALTLFFAFLLTLRNQRIADFCLPYINQYFLLPFFAFNIIAIIIRPLSMLESNKTIVENMLFTGQWGVIFWIWLATVVAFMKITSTPQNQFFNRIIWSTILIISGLGFFRTPYRLSWNDSANRLMTLVFPIIILIGVTTLAYYFSPKKTIDETSTSSQ